MSINKRFAGNYFVKNRFCSRPCTRREHYHLRKNAFSPTVRHSTYLWINPKPDVLFLHLPISSEYFTLFAEYEKPFRPCHVPFAYRPQNARRAGTNHHFNFNRFKISYALYFAT